MWRRRLRPASISIGCSGFAATSCDSPLGTSTVDRVVDRAVKALNLVLQAGGFALVAIDLADVSPQRAEEPAVHHVAARAAQRRRQRHRVRAVGPEPLARSAGGLTVLCTGQTTWSGRLTGLDARVRVVSPRRRVDGETDLKAAAVD